MTRIFSFARLGLGCPADDDTRLHRRVCKMIRAEAEDAFDEVAALNELYSAACHFFLPEQNAVWPEHRATAGLGIQAVEDVLLKGVVGAALRRRAVKISSPRVGGKSSAIPLFDRIWWIGQAHALSAQRIRRSPCTSLGSASVSPRSMPKILDAVEKAIHPGDGGCHQIPLLPDNSFTLRHSFFCRSAGVSHTRATWLPVPQVGSYTDSPGCTFSISVIK